MESEKIDKSFSNEIDFKKGFLCDLEEDFAKHVGQIRKINNDGSFEYAVLTNWHTTIRDHNNSPPKIPKCDVLAKRIKNSNTKLQNININSRHNFKSPFPKYISPDSKKIGAKLGNWQLCYGWKHRPQNLQIDIAIASENIKIFSQRIEKARNESKSGGFGSEIRPCSPSQLSSTHLLPLKSPPRSPSSRSKISPIKTL